MNKSDRTILKKMQEYQKMLGEAMKEFNISSSSDLASLHYMVRRGMIQTVRDIFELTVPINDGILQKLPQSKIGKLLIIIYLSQIKNPKPSPMIFTSGEFGLFSSGARGET